MNKFIREPLVHFLVLGALIFAAYQWLDDSEGGATDIVVSVARQDNLAAAFERTWRRPPTAAEREGLIRDFVRQEIAYREAQAMQLDEDDIVIRRRLRQKLEMLAQDFAGMNPPTEQDLRDYYADNADDYRRPALLSLRHVYFNVDGDAVAAERRANDLLIQLQTDPPSVDLLQAGDRIMLPSTFTSVRPGELSSMFGEDFAAEVAGLSTGTWAGPVRSGLGLHLVLLTDRVESVLPRFELVAADVERDWFARRRIDGLEEFYEQLSDRYDVVIEPRPAS